MDLSEYEGRKLQKFLEIRKIGTQNWPTYFFSRDIFW